MRTLRIGALVTMLAMASSLAWAWSNVSGTVNSVDTKTHQVTLDDGKTYTLQRGVKMSNIKVGDKVTLSVEMQNGKNVVNKVSKT